MADDRSLSTITLILYILGTFTTGLDWWGAANDYKETNLFLIYAAVWSLSGDVWVVWWFWVCLSDFLIIFLIHTSSSQSTKIFVHKICFHSIFACLLGSARIYCAPQKTSGTWLQYSTLQPPPTNLFELTYTSSKHNQAIVRKLLESLFTLWFRNKDRFDINFITSNVRGQSATKHGLERGSVIGRLWKGSSTQSVRNKGRLWMNG